MPATPELSLKEGNLAPDFTAPASGGAALTHSEFKGKHVVHYYYPKDDKPGSTK